MKKSCTLWGFLVCLPLFFSCDDDADINKIFTISASAPSFVSYRVVSENQIDFTFSTPVRVMDAKLEPPIEIAGWTEGETVSLLFSNEHRTGEQIITDMLVADEHGNTLNLLLPFRTLNRRMPGILINEVRTEYGGSGVKKKGEFIELKTFTAGNLGALRLFIARAASGALVYEFPSVEVDTGEYITLHLRTYPEPNDTAVDELGGRETFDLSGGINAVSGARDLWSHVNSEVIHKTDALYLVDQNDIILDAVIFYDTKKPAEWDNYKVIGQTAELFAQQGAWLSKNGEAAKNLPANDAARNGFATAVRTLCRDESRPDTNTANDWYIAKDGTPGGPNSPIRYTDQ
ncbi:MAG: hypothetical protein LBG74_00120 [Spirochaetaceae bacterium]|nr:hypothetical protein [Spirochaetaceae bacterium]